MICRAGEAQRAERLIAVVPLRNSLVFGAHCYNLLSGHSPNRILVGPVITLQDAGKLLSINRSGRNELNEFGFCFWS